MRPEISAPPAGPVAWRVTDRNGKPLGVVVAQTWFGARAIALAQFHREVSEVRVELADGKGAAR